MGRGKNRLPDGWAPLPARGAVVEGTQFLPVKVPLGAAFGPGVQSCASQDSGVAEEALMLDSLLADLRGTASTLVDLTNTDRYYDVGRVSGAGVTHVKIMGLAGHGVIPDQRSVAAFIAAAGEAAKADPSKLVVVHCTHGYNRTGFMICSYMIQVMRLSASEALTRFATARPPGIYKAAYIDYLLWAAGELSPNAPLPFTYPPSTQLHDDETRAEAVCHAESGGVVDAVKFAASEPRFKAALRGRRAPTVKVTKAALAPTGKKKRKKWLAENGGGAVAAAVRYLHSTLCSAPRRAALVLLLMLCVLLSASRRVRRAVLPWLVRPILPPQRVEYRD